MVVVPIHGRLRCHRGDANNVMVQAGIHSARVPDRSRDNVFSMYVGSLHPDNTAAVTKTYLVNRGISVSEITKVSPEDKSYNSFHIKMPKKDYMKIIKNKRQYWPEGVTCRRYYPPKQPESGEGDVPLGGQMMTGVPPGSQMMNGVLHDLLNAEVPPGGRMMPVRSQSGAALNSDRDSHTGALGRDGTVERDSDESDGESGSGSDDESDAEEETAETMTQQSNG